MTEDLRRVFECLTLLGLGPGECLVQMEENGIATEAALEAILERPDVRLGSLALARARCGLPLSRRRQEC